MSNGNAPRKHHYLPQFYLKGFAVRNEGLYQIQKSTGKIVGVRIKDAAAIRDFHIIDDGEIADPQALEKALAVVEGALAPYLAHMLGGGFHDRATQMYVAQLVCLLRLRVPAVRDHIQESESAYLHTHIQMQEAAGKLPSAPEGMDAWSMADVRVEMMNWAIMDRIFRMASDDDVLSTYYALKPTLLHAPMGEQFIASDQPVALYHAEAGTGYGIGPETPGVVISMPLSSRAAILLENRIGPPIERIANSAEVAEINRRTSLMASEWLFTGEAPQQLMKILDDVRGIRAGFAYEQVPTANGTGYLLRYVGVGPAASSLSDASTP